MRILLISSAFTGLTQRFYTELNDAGYIVSVELHQGDIPKLLKGVALFKPNLIICPYLIQRIPKKLYQKYKCLIVHPGIKGDRGPSSLDWAIQNGDSEWGVTLLEARAEMDTGDIWAAKTFPMRVTTKSSLFNREVTQAATDCLWEVLTYIDAPDFQPETLNYNKADVNGKLRPLMTQKDRRINWQQQTSDEILRRINAADGGPGVLDEINGRSVYLYNAHKADQLSGKPGDIIATSNYAVCRATIDGAIWIGHMKAKGKKEIKLPATFVLKDLLMVLQDLSPQSIKTIDIDYTEPGRQLPCQEIWYEQEADIAYIHSHLHNGGMCTEQCQLLLTIYRHVAKLPVKVIVLMGGEESWSNGIHLNYIEHAENPAHESWLNINAIDDLIYQIITTPDKLTISAIAGNAGAGGAMMALASDMVYAREGVVINPHYKNMGGLYGSEYWTYSLPKRVGQEMAAELTEQCLPISARRAWQIGFVDNVLDKNHDIFYAQVRQMANLAISDNKVLQDCLSRKAKTRRSAEVEKPLAAYRKYELAQMYANFYGNGDYHEARRHFVYKVSKKGTPANIAKHRQFGMRIKKYFRRNSRKNKPVFAVKANQFGNQSRL